MNYTVNLGEWNKVFCVPSVVVDKHLKMAGSAQLKVLLYLLRHAGEEDACHCAAISAAVGLSGADTADAMQYWIESGVLSKNDDSLSVPEKKKKKAEPAAKELPKELPVKEEARPPQAPVIVSLPRVSHSQAALRMKQSKKIAFMLNDVQLRLARPITPTEQAVLISLCDNVSLPVDVVLMVVEFAVCQGKASVHYIEKVGMDWANNGINTHAKAQKKLAEIHQMQNAWYTLERALGLPKSTPSSKEQECADLFINQWKFAPPVLKKAYDICKDNTGKVSFAYIKKILENWHEQGIETLEAAEALSRQELNKASGRSASKKPRKATSYDLDDIEDMIYGKYTN